MAYTNGGHQDYDHTATLKILPFEVFFDEKSLGNTFLCHIGVQVQGHYRH